eukprot:7689323-Pyramimonas_sp.AAC.1
MGPGAVREVCRNRRGTRVNAAAEAFGGDLYRATNRRKTIGAFGEQRHDADDGDGDDVDDVDGDGDNDDENDDTEDEDLRRARAG